MEKKVLKTDLACPNFDRFQRKLVKQKKLNVLCLQPNNTCNLQNKTKKCLGCIGMLPRERLV